MQISTTSELITVNPSRIWEKVRKRHSATMPANVVRWLFIAQKARFVRTQWDSIASCIGYLRHA